MYVRLAVVMLLSAFPPTLMHAAEQQNRENSQPARGAPAQSPTSSGGSRSTPSSSWWPWSSSHSSTRATLSGSRSAGQPSPYYASPAGNGLPPADEPVAISEPSRTAPSAHFSLPPLRGALPPPHVTDAPRSTPPWRVTDPEPVLPPRFFLRPARHESHRDERAQERVHNEHQLRDPRQQTHEPQPGSPNPQVGMLGAAARAGVSPESVRLGFFASHYVHHDQPQQWHADRLPAGLAWRGHHHAAFVAWTGPLFWPYFFGDLFYYTFWPDAYDDAYWPYAYDDLFDSIYWATGNPDSGAPYSAPTAASIGLTPGSSRGTQPTSSAAADICASDDGITAWPFARVQSVLKLTVEQQALLDVLKDVAAQAASHLNASCPHEAALTPTGRLQAMIERLQAALKASHAIHAPLMTFYGSLSDEQKARFNAIGPTAGPKAATARHAEAACPEQKPALADLPTERIADAVGPSDSQQGRLDELAKANTRAIAILQAACPDPEPRAPVGRLEAIETRLDAMTQAAKTIQPALKEFYGSLTDEQKSRFNTLGNGAGRSLKRASLPDDVNRK
jgi:hypothetical protein